METHFPQLESEEFILEQIRAPEEAPKYPLPPEVIAVLEKFQNLLSIHYQSIING